MIDYEKRFYLIREQYSVEVVNLMLDNSSCEILELHIVFPPLDIEELDLDPVPPLDHATLTRDREASFLIGTFFFRVFGNHRIEEGNGSIVFIIIIPHQ